LHVVFALVQQTNTVYRKDNDIDSTKEGRVTTYRISFCYQWITIFLHSRLSNFKALTLMGALQFENVTIEGNGEIL
jgi:hypothetical protein